jgi:hypothetical protein
VERSLTSASRDYLILPGVKVDPQRSKNLRLVIDH